MSPINLNADLGVGDAAICFRDLQTFSIISSVPCSFASSTPMSSVVFPARRKPPVVASFVTPIPAFIS